MQPLIVKHTGSSIHLALGIVDSQKVSDCIPILIKELRGNLTSFGKLV